LQPFVREDRPQSRIGFVGVGWIGQHRLKVLKQSQLVEVSAITDTCAERINEVRMALGDVAVCECYEQLLEQPIDAIVIATPSALHAVQAIEAIGAGKAVFCQKPLSRNRSRDC
jgi:predicted dehydrogenase